MSDHHVRWSSFQWWTSLCWSYLLYDSRSIFRSQCSEAISSYARLVKFNLSILRVQNWLAPVGDGDQRRKMIMAISCHIFWLHVMFILYASYFAWFGGSIIRWSLTKFQGISVLPEYAPLLQFVVTRHHVMIGCDKLYFHIQRVQASFAHTEYSG